LFEWHLEIGSNVMDSAKRIADALNEYISWIQSSGLTSSFCQVEFLLNLDLSIVEELTSRAISTQTGFQFQKRGLAFSAQPLPREIAYISHAQRTIPELQRSFG